MSTRPDTSREDGAPGGWDREWKRRLELATPQDTARGLFFNGMLDTRACWRSSSRSME